MNLLDGSRQGNIQVGTESGQNIQFSISSIQTKDIGKEVAASTVTDATLATGNSVIVTYGGTNHTFTVSGADDAAMLVSLQSGLDAANLDITASAGTGAGEFTLTADNKVATPISVAAGAAGAEAATGTAVAGGGSMLNSIAGGHS